MQIENHKEEVPFAHYEELFMKLDPADAVARLSTVKWDGNEFFVTLLGRDFAISHPDYAIRALDEGKLPPLPTQTFLLRYLLECKDVQWRGEWKTFREMPWGEMYIKPYTGRVLTRAAFTFGFRTAAMGAAAEPPSSTEMWVLNSIWSAAIKCGSWSGKATMSSPPMPRSCIPTILPMASRRKTAWLQATS